MSGKNFRGMWLKDPRQARPGETIGGGHFVFRRGDGTKRIRPSMWPFEYATEAEAKAQAELLASTNPGFLFDVVKVVDTVFTSGPDAPPAIAAEAAS